GEPNKQEAVSFLIATDRGDVGRLLAGHPFHGLAYPVFRSIGVFVAFVHRQGFTDGRDVETFVPEEFDIPDTVTRESRRCGRY
ncbi:MAG: hypothetical protein HYS04_00155, partial [Acidobacteria bacterium]|nr:hypothetical protein [Acidobacteriota bacterium]